MTRFTLAALAALSIIALSAQQEPAQHGQRFGRVEQEPQQPEPARLTKRQAEQYAAGRERLATATRLEKLVGEFRRALTETDTATPPYVRAANDGSPRQVGQDITGVEIVALDTALRDEPIGTQFLWVRLYGANQRLREEVRLLRAELGKQNDWPPANDEWPDEDDSPGGDGPPAGDDEPGSPPGGGDDPPAGEGGDSSSEVLARINCGGGAAGDWAEDWGFAGGASDWIVGTFPAPYDRARAGGSFAYRVPVEPGKYRVRLHFVEIYFATNPGRRVFDVTIGGKLVLDGYSPPVNPTALEFDVEAPGDTLEIRFEASVDQVVVSGIEVVRR